MHGFDELGIPAIDAKMITNYLNTQHMLSAKLIIIHKIGQLKFQVVQDQPMFKINVFS